MLRAFIPNERWYHSRARYTLRDGYVSEPCAARPDIQASPRMDGTASG
jgi:hypothetical protein